MKFTWLTELVLARVAYISFSFAAICAGQSLTPLALTWEVGELGARHAGHGHESCVSAGVHFEKFIVHVLQGPIHNVFPLRALATPHALAYTLC